MASSSQEKQTDSTSSIDKRPGGADENSPGVQPGGNAQKSDRVPEGRSNAFFFLKGRAHPNGQGSLSNPGSAYSTAFVAIAFLYHSALSFGYRFSVLKST